jgi:hypothetical protein
MTLTHQKRTELFNRLNFAVEKLKHAKETAKQATLDTEIWARELKAIRKDLEEGTE